MIDPQHAAQAVLAGDQREVPRIPRTCRGEMLCQLTEDQKRVLSLMNTAVSRPYSLPG